MTRRCGLWSWRAYCGNPRRTCVQGRRWSLSSIFLNLVWISCGFWMILLEQPVTCKVVYNFKTSCVSQNVTHKTPPNVLYGTLRDNWVGGIRYSYKLYAVRSGDLFFASSCPDHSIQGFQMNIISRKSNNTFVCYICMSWNMIFAF